MSAAWLHIEYLDQLRLFPHRPEAANEFYDGDHDNDKESDVEIWWRMDLTRVFSYEDVHSLPYL